MPQSTHWHGVQYSPALRLGRLSLLHRRTMADRRRQALPFVLRGSTKDVRASLTFPVSASPLISWSWSFTNELLSDPCFRTLEAAASGRAQGVGCPYLASPTLKLS